jgi:lipopolysaccharide transport system ATP-binding protein
MVNYLSNSETVIKMTDCSVLLPLKTNQTGDFRREVVQSILGGEIFKNRKKRSYVRAINKVSLEIKKGERIGVVGSNGSGKTTFLKTISGVYAPQEGKIDINVDMVSLLNLGFGMQPELSGEENLANLCVQFNLNVKQTINRAQEILDFSQLGEFFYQPVKTYSSGMRMRLLLAVATLSPADMLVMDEWFSTGDASFRLRADKRISKHLDRSGILILASHNIGLLQKWTSKTIWFHRGEIKKIGKTDDITREYLEFSKL